jgi:selenocysteine lyase/cysteine desulfurase
MDDKYVELMALIQSMCASVYALEGEPSNKIQQKEVNNNVASVVQYGLDHLHDMETITIIYNTLVETYMRVIAMNFDTVHDVIDTLTMARMIVRNILHP